MPRKSSEALLFPPVDGSPARLEPPVSLSETERNIFASLVATVDKKHFRPSDLPLVCSYARAIDLEGRAAKALADDPLDKGWLAVWEKASRVMVALSLRLKLSPQSRLSNRAAEREKSVFKRPWA